MRLEMIGRQAFTLALILVGIGIGLTATAADEPYKAQIDSLRKSLEKYQDYKVAVRDLYLSTVGCSISSIRMASFFTAMTWFFPKCPMEELSAD